MYNAFISYSHAADGRMAPALQAALERFAKPWYKLRNLNIFRDEASLSASPHLWSNIQEALDDSEYLIYMASPESAQSKWVNKEIEYWLETKSLDTILIVLSDGNLYWNNGDNKTINTANNSLPSILNKALKNEPFYVDLLEMRTELDLSLKNPIFKKEVLKLAAQLHGKAPKDFASEEVNTHRKMIWTRNIAVFLVLSLLFYSFLSTKSALDISESSKKKDIAIEKQKLANIEKEKDLENEKLEKKILDDSLRIKDDSLKSAQKQKKLADKLARTQLKLKEQAEKYSRMAQMSQRNSQLNQNISDLARENSEAKWNLMDTLRLHGLSTSDSYRIIKLFEKKDQGWQSNIFYNTKNVSLEKDKNLAMYKIKLLDWNSEVISEIDSVSLK